MAGLAAALAVLLGATLIASAPSSAPRSTPAGAAPSILTVTRHWLVVQTLHGTGSAAPAPLQLGSVACAPAGGRCVAVGGPFVATRSPAGSWTVRDAPAAVGYLTSVACPGVRTCIAVAQPSGAVGDLAMSTSDGGITWTPHALRTAVQGLSSVACASPTTCTAVGEGRKGAVVATTTDSGATWEAADAPAALGGLDAVGCSVAPSPVCVAVGWLHGGSSPAIAVLPHSGAQAGAGWLVVRAPAGIAALGAVACPSPQTCLVGGFLRPAVPASGAPAGAGGAGGAAGATPRRFPGAVARSGDGGRHWALLHLPTDAGPVNALSCVDITSCVAAGVSATPAAHATSNTRSGPTTTAATTTAAAAAGPPGMAISTGDAGRTWQVDTLPPAVSGVAGVACMPAGGRGGSPACVATAAGPASSSLVVAGG